MPVIPSSIDPTDERYQQNRAAMLEHIDAFERYMAESRSGGGEKYIQRHRDRGKLLVRERIELLLDRDSPFFEFSSLAAWGTEYDLLANVVTGLGVVSGVECVISANDPTMKGGSSKIVWSKRHEATACVWWGRTAWV